MGSLFGSGKKAAKRQAAATLKAAEMEAANDRVMGQAAQSARETMIAQNSASQRAAELLSRPQEQVEVQLGPAAAPAEIDPETGRRRSTRSAFRSARKSSGINI